MSDVASCATAAGAPTRPTTPNAAMPTAVTTTLRIFV